MNEKLARCASTIRDSGCQRCPDLVQMRSQIVVSKGNTGADVCFVGQNPGADEDRIGSPFMGRAGKALDSIIRATGYDPLNDFYFTNAVMCHTEGNATPETHHIQNCSTNLEQIAEHFEKFIAVGKPAHLGLLNLMAPDLYHRVAMSPHTKSLTSGMPSRYEWKGKVRYIYTVYHTAFIIRPDNDGNPRVRTNYNGEIDPRDVNHPLFRMIGNEIKSAKELDVNPRARESQAPMYGGFF